MICKNCGKEIDNKATVCVHCGVAVKAKKPIYKKWWFWVLIVVVIIAVSASAGGNEGAEGSSSDGKDVSSTQIVYESVDLKTMLDELSANALKAEKTYQGKYVEITGKISNFDSDGDYISIKPVNSDEWDFLDSVMCEIKNEDQEDYLLNKSVGDTVTVKGKITSIGEVLGYSIDIAEVK